MKKYISLLTILYSIAIFSQNQPNILWIVTEDISPTLSMYGDTTAKTPTLDKLAAESMVYTNVFAPVGVCAPSRSAIITGVQPTSLGTMHMRAGKDVMSWGKRVYKTDKLKNGVDVVDMDGNPLREYASVIPADVKCFPQYLRADGYFCTNNEKTDYQFAAPITAWDENNAEAHWRNRPNGMPFFSVFNIGITHESRLWKNDDLPLTVNPDAVKVPPYLPDTKATRKTIARHYSNVELMDKEVAVIINQLREDGLYDNTIIFFYSDHGGPLPRQKREIYDSGLHVPFMIKDINSKTIGTNDQMISFVDLAPTILSIANIAAPEYMQGAAFLGSKKGIENNYIFASSDRFDEYSDRTRAIRTKKFLYLKNYYPELTKYKDVGYRKNIPMMNPMLAQKENNELTDAQMIWFGTKTSEELYDCENDPHNLHNLANDPTYKKELEAMRATFKGYQKNHVDLAEIGEATLIEKGWPNGVQPTTAKTDIKKEQGKIILNCDTEGASIAYKIADNPDEKFNYNDHWKLYSKPINIEKGKYLYTISERIGYKESEVVLHKL
ncbi:MAG: sulfatase [Flavobacteriaceae bacterium]|nr:MAG: sulfatase [Flavobacteriaceae bacterium]